MSLWDLDILYNIAICNRFHGLIEFDEGKRSCRRRLAGHNERRRKPQPDAFGLHTRFLPAFQGKSPEKTLMDDGNILYKFVWASCLVSSLSLYIVL